MRESEQMQRSPHHVALRLAPHDVDRGVRERQVLNMVDVLRTERCGGSVGADALVAHAETKLNGVPISSLRHQTFSNAASEPRARYRADRSWPTGVTDSWRAAASPRTSS